MMLYGPISGNGMNSLTNCNFIQDTYNLGMLNQSPINYGDQFSSSLNSYCPQHIGSLITVPTFVLQSPIDVESLEDSDDVSECEKRNVSVVQHSVTHQVRERTLKPNLINLYWSNLLQQQAFQQQKMMCENHANLSGENEIKVKEEANDNNESIPQTPTLPKENEAKEPLINKEQDAKESPAMQTKENVENCVPQEKATEKEVKTVLDYKDSEQSLMDAFRKEIGGLTTFKIEETNLVQKRNDTLQQVNEMIAVAKQEIESNTSEFLQMAMNITNPVGREEMKAELLKMSNVKIRDSTVALEDECNKDFRTYFDLLVQQTKVLVQQSEDDKKNQRASTSVSTSKKRKREDPKVVDPTSTKWKKKGLDDDSKTILEKWFIQHSDNPYPSSADKELLRSKCITWLGKQATKQQIENWFINTRIRVWRPIVSSKDVPEVKETQPSPKKRRISS